MPPTSAFQPSSHLNLTITEKRAVKKYTDGSSLWMNRYLRQPTLDLPDRDARLIKKVTTLLGKAIMKSPPSTRAVTVYRAVELIYPEWGNTSVGAILPHTRTGMVSTSFSRASAALFLEDDYPSCMLILTLPKGTRGLYIKEVSFYDDEDELLLPHGSLFRVTKRSFIIHKGKQLLAYYARLVSQAKMRRLRPI